MPAISRQTRTTDVVKARAPKSDKYDRILSAAVKIFAQKGFFHARISEIAKEAKVADGTIYLYFENKDDILISLFEDQMDKVIGNMKQAMAEENGALGKIRSFALTHLKMVERHPDLAEVIQVELRQSSKFMKEYKNVKFLDYLDLVGQIIRDGQAAHEIRADLSPTVAKRAFFGALDEMSRYYVLSPSPKVSIEEAAHQISEVFIRGIAA